MVKIPGVPVENQITTLSVVKIAIKFSPCNNQEIKLFCVSIFRISVTSTEPPIPRTSAQAQHLQGIQEKQQKSLKLIIRRQEHDVQAKRISLWQCYAGFSFMGLVDLHEKPHGWTNDKWKAPCRFALYIWLDE